MENESLLAGRRRFWTCSFGDWLVKAALLSAQYQSQLIDQNVVEQMFVIARFALQDRRNCSPEGDGEPDNEFVNIRAQLIKLLLAGKGFGNGIVLSNCHLTRFPQKFGKGVS